MTEQEERILAQALALGFTANEDLSRVSCTLEQLFALIERVQSEEEGS